MQVKTTSSERRWQGYDWFKLVVAGVLAASLIRFGPGTQAAVTPTALPTAAPATALPTAAAVGAATALPTAAAAGATTALPAIIGPTIDPLAADLVAGPVSLTGTGEPGSVVRVTINGVAAGTADVAADGRWSLDTILPAGSMAIVAESLDTAGAAVAASASLDIIVSVRGASGTINATATAAPASTTAPTSTAAPAATAVSSGTAAPASTTSAIVGGPLTITVPEEGDQIAPGPLTISGTGTPGTELEVLDSDRVAGEATVDDDGTWSADVELQAGTAAVSVREQGATEIVGRPIRITVGEVAASSCSSLAVNCQAFVTRAGSLTLRVRSSPEIADGNIIARLPIGSEMTLLEGPEPNSGFSWWRVRTRGGNEGWVAGENLVLQPD